MKKRLLGIGFGVFVLVVWYLLALLINKSFILPSPLKVFASLQKNWDALMNEHFPATMAVVIKGCLISIILGVALAVIMTVSRSVENAIYPILAISQTIPTMCMAPIFVLWFGYTEKTRVIIVVLMTFFSITVNVFDGFNSVRTDTSELIHTYGASKIQEFFILKVPTALPNFFTALKVSVPWAVVAAAISEWFGAPAGLGFFSRQKMMSLDAAGLLAPLIIISVTALLITLVISVLQRKIVTWSDD